MITKKFYIAIAVFALVVSILVVMVNACSINFTNPPPVLKEPDLEGVWTTHYTRGTADTITINSDGTFRQVFEDSDQNYVFDSGWNHWTLEKLQNGEMRLRLQGGRFYNEGITLAERKGRKDPNYPCLDTDCTWGLKPYLF